MMPVLRNVQWKSVWLTNQVIISSSLTSSHFFLFFFLFGLDFFNSLWMGEKADPPVGTAFPSHHQLPLQHC